PSVVQPGHRPGFVDRQPGHQDAFPRPAADPGNQAEPHGGVAGVEQRGRAYGRTHASAGAEDGHGGELGRAGKGGGGHHGRGGGREASSGGQRAERDAQDRDRGRQGKDGPRSRLPAGFVADGTPHG